MVQSGLALAASVTLLSALACASGGTRAAAACESQPADSVYQGSEPAWRACAVERPARLLSPGQRINWQPPGGPALSGTRCFVAQLEFVVDSAGLPEPGTARVVHSNEPGFAQAVLASLPDWRYRPALRAGVPVRQIVSERRTSALVTRIVAVPAGSGPPSVPPPTSPPRC
ncbi:MAG TPA: hypothetical protein VLE53_13305 [Gemmatimonadaceae bacterium]|nr:hypothetical protein [Gemmatimonadaceae bacterium]